MSINDYFSSNKFDFSLTCRNNAKKFIVEQNLPAETFLKILQQQEEDKQIPLIVILDSLVEDQPDFLNSSMDSFIEIALKTLNETAKRCISRIFYHLLRNQTFSFSASQKQKIIILHFDWLIKPSLVATRVNCISVLFYLRDEEDWITADLLAIIDNELLKNEPSFRSRASKVIRKIEKNQSRL